MVGAGGDVGGGDGGVFDGWWGAGRKVFRRRRGITITRRLTF